MLESLNFIYGFLIEEYLTSIFSSPIQSTGRAVVLTTVLVLV